MIYFLMVLTVSAVVTYLLTPPVRRLSLRLGIYTGIRSRDIHTEVKPRWGGVAIYLGLIAGIAVSALIPLFAGIFADITQVLGVLLAMTLIVITGMADDAWDIHWLIKLVAQIGSGLILVLHGIQLEVMPVGWLGVGGPVLQSMLTVFLVVLTINAFNFIDGLDGLAAGVAAIGGAAFFIYTYLLTLSIREFEPSHLATLLMAVLVGACLGFLPHNFHPSKLIMGDTGAMLLGFVMAAGALIATSSLELHQEQFRFRNIPAYMPVLLPLAVMVLPVLDLVLAVIRRTIRGQSPFSPDRGHLHHKLLDSGYSHPQAVLLLYLWAAVIAFGSISFNFLPWWLVGSAMAVTLAVATVLTLGPWLRRRAQRVNARAAGRTAGRSSG
ncbi:MraY family glycosyltransferase [Nesterenkonia alkaliphila]|uniref:Undecaprenyl/decaprenyl-phosphate alpha-N-acetylglucosaminyl 1-phosphate transferase n=1 Tax=Nesterenkonia alkaliphila TaxID=1463631 RepID=A0A7K1UFW2_9MICC|nr:MraY family glycosyltransferase [Nesterenkonia alkaliphila]MVT25339.1 undecaprenyl/decaprenyl-phosphate alpha-N-acetylglucosaminyl 1-phosphate transferase [Nesterenkonia alkaliphila]GFZ94467.1 undecaprenyl-phosphate alpha-N-acetylglucosaminyl 1-phosphate transferase [Nesterenkonia alkaliphila]